MENFRTRSIFLWLYNLASRWQQFVFAGSQESRGEKHLFPHLYREWWSLCSCSGVYMAYEAPEEKAEMTGWKCDTMVHIPHPKMCNVFILFLQWKVGLFEQRLALYGCSDIHRAPLYNSDCQEMENASAAILHFWCNLFIESNNSLKVSLT